MADAPLLLNIETQCYEEPEQEETRNRFSLLVLLKIDPQNYQVYWPKPTTLYSYSHNQSQIYKSPYRLPLLKSNSHPLKRQPHWTNNK
nr:hypothetical protein [Tanacetum cinerariifolium]